MHSISELIGAYKLGQTTPTEYIGGLLNKAKTLKDLNIFISIDSEQLMQDAKKADLLLANKSDLPLLGVPIAVKDLIDVANMRSTMGSAIYKDAPLAKLDASIVKKLRDAGAIIFGKANTHEFAYGSTGDVSFAGPVKNPLNTKHITGGSSSGSAAALAAGLSMASLGTDTSCSVRLPAAFCGVVGLKATYGLLANDGIFPLSETLDHLGPLSLNIQDNALLLDILTGTDKSYTSLIGQSIQGKTVGLLDGDFFQKYLQDDIRSALDNAKKVFESHGAKVIPIQIPDIFDIYKAQQLIIKAEAYYVHEDKLLNNAEFQPEVRERLAGGDEILALDYIKALKYRDQAVKSFNQALDGVDVLFSAVCGISPPLQNERETMLNEKIYKTPWLLTRLTAPTNLSMHPSLSVPFGKDKQDLPIGIQLIARLNDEARLYQYGAVLEPN